MKTGVFFTSALLFPGRFFLSGRPGVQQNIGSVGSCSGEKGPGATGGAEERRRWWWWCWWGGVQFNFLHPSVSQPLVCIECLKAEVRS